MHVKLVLLHCMSSYSSLVCQIKIEAWDVIEVGLTSVVRTQHNILNRMDVIEVGLTSVVSAQHNLLNRIDDNTQNVNRQIITTLTSINKSWKKLDPSNVSLRFLPYRLFIPSSLRSLAIITARNKMSHQVLRVDARFACRPPFSPNPTPAPYFMPSSHLRSRRLRKIHVPPCLR